MPQPGNPFVVPGMNPVLAEIISIHRGLTGGYTMTATTTEGAAGADAGAAGQQQGADGADATQGGQQAATQPPAATQGQESDADKIARLERELTAARGEAGKERVNAKQAAADAARNELTQQIGKALGLIKDDSTKLDPADLVKQVDTEKATAAAAQVQIAVYRAAGKHGADPEALLDSNNFLRSLDGLAPTDAEKIDAAIKAAVDSNPKLKLAQAAGRSGPEHTGGSGAAGKPTTLEDAIAAKLAAQSSH